MESHCLPLLGCLPQTTQNGFLALYPLARQGLGKQTSLATERRGADRSFLVLAEAKAKQLLSIKVGIRICQIAQPNLVAAADHDGWLAIFPFSKAKPDKHASKVMLNLPCLPLQHFLTTVAKSC